MWWARRPTFSNHSRIHEHVTAVCQWGQQRPYGAAASHGRQCPGAGTSPTRCIIVPDIAGLTSLNGLRSVFAENRKCSLGHRIFPRSFYQAIGRCHTNAASSRSCCPTANVPAAMGRTRTPIPHGSQPSCYGRPWWARAWFARPHAKAFFIWRRPEFLSGRGHGSAQTETGPT